MKIKRNMNVKKIIIFAMILFEFSIVFLFTNVNFDNSLVSNNSSLEEEDVGAGFQSDKIVPKTTGIVKTAILRPNMDKQHDWDGSPTPHWSRIDEVSPDGVYVTWIAGDELQLERFAMDVGNVEEVSIKITKVEVHIRGFRYWTGAPNVSIYCGGWTDEIIVPITTLVIGQDEWISCSWSDLSGNYDNLKNLQVRIEAGDWCSGPPRNGYCRIDTLYCEVTYELVDMGLGSITLRPNEDILTEWVYNTQPHWSSIDEEIPDSERVGWVDGEENALEIFGFESAYFENVIVTAVEIYAYGHRYYSGPASASILLGEWTQNLELNLPVQGESWSNCRWNNLEGSYEDLQNLQVKIAAGTWCSANGYGYINTLYVVVTTDKLPLWRY